MRKIFLALALIACAVFSLAPTYRPYLANFELQPNGTMKLNNTGVTVQLPGGLSLNSSGLTGNLLMTGGINPSLNAITGADSLTVADCGRITTVSAAVDTHSITLPEASTVLGCTFTLVYIGADGGALLDVTPLDSDADGIEGGCTLAGSVVTYSGTADADVGLTKATILTGDYLKLTAVAANMYAQTGSQGICANN